jgi:hypothetical protein
MGYLDFYKLSPEEKMEIFSAVSNQIGLPLFAVEKDWWVVRVLDIIFQTEIAAHTVFKGGTSLSKAWGLIQRFSEDVDLALDRSFLGFDEANPSRTKITQLRKDSKVYILDKLIPQLTKGFEAAELNEVTIEVRETSESDQDPLIIEIYYPYVTEHTAYVSPRVLIEIGIRSLREPFSEREITSAVAEVFPDSEFIDTPISIPTVNPERTFLEKLFLLHEEFQRPPERMRVERLSRHLYDIHQISKSEFYENALADKDLYEGIVEHRSIFAKLGGVDYTSHFAPNLNPIPPDNIMEEWEKDYATMQEQMIYGETISFKELIAAIDIIKNTINGQ